MKRIFLVLLSILLSIAISSGVAFSYTATSKFYGNADEPNILQDDDVEWMVSNDGNSTLDVGDGLQGVFRIPEINTFDITPGTIDAETGLGGVFEIEVLTKEYAGFNPDLGVDEYNYTFGPATYSGAYDFNNPDSMVSLWETEDPLSNFNDDPGNVRTRQELIDDVTDGDLLYEFGHIGDNPLERWSARNTNDEPWRGVNFSTATVLGNFNSLLSTTYNDFLPIVQSPVTDADGNVIGYIDVTGSGSVRGIKEYDTSADLSSDLQYTFRTTPEPTTWFLLGTGLLVVAGLSRKKLMKS